MEKSFSQTEKRLNASCWWLYLSAIVIYIVFVSANVTIPFLDKEVISIFATFLLGFTAYISLSISLNFKNAALLILYWAVVIISAEKYYISVGRYHFPESTFNILGNVPFNLFLNWLIPLFAIYSLGTFLTSRLNIQDKRKRLITYLAIDAFLYITYGLLQDPMNVALGYWTYHTTESDVLIFGVPLYLYYEYLIGAILVNIPIRWFLTYRISPKLDVYYLPLVSYPLYFGWSFIFGITLRQFPVKLYTLGIFGLIVTLIITLFIIWKRRLFYKSI